ARKAGGNGNVRKRLFVNVLRPRFFDEAVAGVLASGVAGHTVPRNCERVGQRTNEKVLFEDIVAGVLHRDFKVGNAASNLILTTLVVDPLRIAERLNGANKARAY